MTLHTLFEVEPQSASPKTSLYDLRVSERGRLFQANEYLKLWSYTQRLSVLYNCNSSFDGCISRSNWTYL